MGSNIIPSWTSVQHTPIVPELLAMQAVSSLCENQFSDHASMRYTYERVYWVLSMRHIRQTPYLDHVVLLLLISSSHSIARLNCIDHIYKLVNIQSYHSINLFIASSYLKIQHIMLRVLCLLLCLFNYVLFQHYSILHV